jgi:nicotinate-nucleotide--dimethylbenzimidazole phosphoribosyltransferase
VSAPRSEIPTVFSAEARAAIYEVMTLRRDVRRFRTDRDVDAAVLGRILHAATLAPSVGFSQPWAFVVVRDLGLRERVRRDFLRCREAEAARFPAERRAKYLGYQLEGILEAPLNLCVVADLRPRDEAILGTTVQPESVRASVSCAVQNLWLAARAEGVGVGWVSIVEPQVLRDELALPAGVEPIAYLCLGEPVEHLARPMLEETQWLPRRSLPQLIHEERWREPHAAPAVADAAPVRLQAVAHQALLTKPVGSLGRLEELATWYASARGVFPCPAPRALTLAVFAADHGVVREGVSAYGSQVTAGMVANVMAGGAAVNVLAHEHGVALRLIDAGVAGDLASVPRTPLVPLERRAVRAGTRNLRTEAALSLDEAGQAMAVGGAVAAEAIAAGALLLGAGEIGIGNTTAAAALVCAFTGAAPDAIVGSGTGLDEAARQRKVAVVTDALRRHRAEAATDPLATLASLGGLEIAAMAGFYLEAARRRVPVVLDGFIADAAALVAQALDANVTAYLMASHASAERGARAALAQLGLSPLLDLGLRLGEGTGAILGMALVRTAVALQGSMATFATAGIVR